VFLRAIGSRRPFDADDVDGATALADGHQNRVRPVRMARVDRLDRSPIVVKRRAQL